MKKTKNISSPHAFQIAAIALGVAIIFAYVSYSQHIRSREVMSVVKDTPQATSTEKVDTGYTYSIEKVGSKTFRDTYKDGVFIKTELISN